MSVCVVCVGFVGIYQMSNYVDHSGYCVYMVIHHNLTLPPKTDEL